MESEMLSDPASLAHMFEAEYFLQSGELSQMLSVTFSLGTQMLRLITPVLDA